jgi:hypothetical protein
MHPSNIMSLLPTNSCRQIASTGSFLQAVEEWSDVSPVSYRPRRGEFYQRAFLAMSLRGPLGGSCGRIDAGHVAFNRGWRVEFSRYVRVYCLYCNETNTNTIDNHRVHLRSYTSSHRIFICFLFWHSTASLTHPHHWNFYLQRPRSLQRWSASILTRDEGYFKFLGLSRVQECPWQVSMVEGLSTLTPRENQKPRSAGFACVRHDGKLCQPSPHRCSSR